jgi:hypothetical protein
VTFLGAGGSVSRLTGCGVESVVITSYEDSIMLYTIAIVLLILWVLGLVSSYTIGGFIHILLVVAIVIILVRLISGRGNL